MSTLVIVSVSVASLLVGGIGGFFLAIWATLGVKK